MTYKQGGLRSDCLHAQTSKELLFAHIMKYHLDDAAKI